MIEDRAVTCTFGVRPRSRFAGKIGSDAFGSAQAIGPHFGLMAPAEAKAAIAMMEDRGHTAEEMAEACGCSLTDLSRIGGASPRPVPAPGGMDDIRAPGSKPDARTPRRRHAPADLDRALRLIASRAAESGSRLDDRFLVTLDMLAELLDSSIGLARDRARALMAAGLIDWRIPTGQPGSMLITAAGRLRLEALGLSVQPGPSSGLPSAWAAHRAAKATARGRSTEKAAEAKAMRMLVVLDRLRAEEGVGPASGFAASMATVTRASGLIDKTARNHLDLVIRQGWVDRDASKGRCSTFTITAEGRAVLAGTEGEDA